jgi:hypothetical protein
MSNNVRVRPIGFWTFNSNVLPAEFELIDSQLTGSVAGSGGTYAPSSLLTIGGLGMTVSGPFTASNVTSMSVAGSLNILLGSTLQLFGNQVVNGGSIVGFQGGSFLTMSLGSTFTQNVGATATFNGTNTFTANITLNSPAGLQYNAPRSFGEACIGPMQVDTTKWQPDTVFPFTWPARAQQTASINPANVNEYLAYELVLPPQATIVDVSVWVAPAVGHGGLPATRPQIRVELYDPNVPSATTLGLAVHSTGVLATYELRTQLTVTCPPATVVTASQRVKVYVAGEGGANFLAGLVVDSPSGTYTLSALPLG